MIESFGGAPPSDDVPASAGGVDDWEEVEPPHAWDHGHCEFCQMTLEEQAKSELKSPMGRRVITHGYLVVRADVETQKWICETCFKDFRIEFKWSVVDATDDSSG
jgi:hypothetical protein